VTRSRLATTEPTIFHGNGRHEVKAASGRGASQAARIQGVGRTAQAKVETTRGGTRSWSLGNDNRRGRNSRIDAAADSGPAGRSVIVTGLVSAVTGTVTAVTWGRDPSAGRDQYRAGRDRRGRSSISQSPGRRPWPSPARHTEVARSRNARLRDRSFRHVSPRSLELSAASLSVASLQARPAE
jgi:hypothetical protein